MNQKETIPKKYVKIQKISQGSYGVVYKARNIETSQIVAIKKFKNITNQGIPVSCIRQLHVLNILKSIVNNDTLQRTLKFIEINNKQSEQIQVVLEWMDQTLTKLLQKNQYNLKRLFKDIVQSTLQIHENGIIHRDIKSQNIMINNATGMVKLIDYGMAKQIDFDSKPMTNQVGSLFYRSPELILGSKIYSHQIDIWSLGCVFYQMLTRNILFKGQNEIDQISKIFKVTGTPTKDDGTVFLLYNKLFQDDEPLQNKWDYIKQQINNDQAFQLLKKMLSLNPDQRPVLTAIMSDNYFQQD